MPKTCEIVRGMAVCNEYTSKIIGQDVGPKYTSSFWSILDTLLNANGKCHISYMIHPLLHGLSARRCPMSPHCVSIQAIGTGSGILGFRPYWCPFLFPSSSVSGCFSIHSSSPAIEFHSCFILMTDVSVPIDRPFTYSLFR